jgi:hypothetical protein
MLLDNANFDGVFCKVEGDEDVDGLLGSINLNVDETDVPNLLLLKPQYPESIDVESWLIDRGSCTLFSILNFDGLAPGDKKLISLLQGLIGHGRGLDAGLFDE